jgi:hypothetical protein
MTKYTIAADDHLLRRSCTIVCFLLLAGLFMAPQTASAQRYLLIEKANSPRTTKIGEGSVITYRLKGDPEWHTGRIEHFRTDQPLIAVDDYYVNLTEVEALRKTRLGARAGSAMLTTFGLSWSGLALIGKLTDGDPETQYNARDAAISATSVASGWLIGKLFRYRTFTVGNRYRLRIIDLTFR